LAAVLVKRNNRLKILAFHNQVIALQIFITYAQLLFDPLAPRLDQTDNLPRWRLPGIAAR
jgi:hypothetical protein